MLDLLTSKTYEATVLGFLGILLVVISSLNMKIRPYMGGANIDPNAVYCFSFSADENGDEKQEKINADAAFSLVWVAFVVGVLLILHSIILVLSMGGGKKN